MDPESLQKYPNYDAQAILDRQNQQLIEQVELLSNCPSNTFDESVVIRTILYPENRNLSLTSEEQSIVDFVMEVKRAICAGSNCNYVYLVHEACKLVVATKSRAAAALGASRNMLKGMKIATGGIDPETQTFSEVIAIRSAVEKLETTRQRGASLSKLTAAILDDFVDTQADYYRIFAGVAESDGLVRDRDQCSQCFMLGLLVAFLFRKAGQSGSTDVTEAFRAHVETMASEVAEKLPGKYQRLHYSLEGLEAYCIFNMVIPTLSGKHWYNESDNKIITNYLWDPEALTLACKHLDHVSVDHTGSKISGCYLRSTIAWIFFACALVISILAGVGNWGSRPTHFERVNDTFQTFLLFLAVPAFTVKIMSDIGEQAIKNWLTGCIRMKIWNKSSGLATAHDGSSPAPKREGYHRD